jgi:hypothetical protein
MSICRWLSFVFLVLMSCTKDKITLPDFDEDRWKQDRNACHDLRGDLAETILEHKSLLLAHNELEVVGVLGKPDENELYKRNEKFYYYYIRPAPECKAGKNISRRLVIRFNAVGLAKEISAE